MKKIILIIMKIVNLKDIIEDIGLIISTTIQKMKIIRLLIVDIGEKLKIKFIILNKFIKLNYLIFE